MVTAQEVWIHCWDLSADRMAGHVIHTQRLRRQHQEGEVASSPLVDARRSPQCWRSGSPSSVLPLAPEADHVWAVHEEAGGRFRRQRSRSDRGCC